MSTHNELKAAFVSNNPGITQQETMILTFCVFCGAAIPRGWRTYAHLSKFKLPLPLALTIEALFMIAPIILSCLSAGNSEDGIKVLGVFTALLGIFGFLCGNARPKKGREAEQAKSIKSRKGERLPPLERLPLLGTMRAILLVSTAFSILAIDFPIYPRSLGKTETFGFSLMDTGVGCFTFCAGCLIGFRGKRVTGWKRKVKTFAPLLGFGFVRLITVWGADYHEHVSEYGKHWNFFFTLATLHLLHSLTQSFTLRPAPKQSLVKLLARPICLGLGCGVTYQLALYLGGTEWVMNGGREGLVAANKEGLLSTFGYFSLFQLALATGRGLSHATTRPDGLAKSGNWIIGLSVVAYLITAAMHTYLEQTSRRLCNLPFIFFMCATCWGIVATLIFLESDLPEKESGPPGVMEAVNANATAFFLLTNVLTGLVNKTIDTINTPDLPAFLLLIAYMLVSLVPLSLYQYRQNGKKSKSKKA